MTLSCDPDDAQIAAANFKEWINQFSRVNVPSAFLLTKFDRGERDRLCRWHINESDRYQPYVRGKDGVGVYNIDRMSTLCRYAKQQEDLLSPNLFTNLLNAMQQEEAIRRKLR